MMTFLKRLVLAPLLLALSAAPALSANSWYDFVTSEASNSQTGGVNTAENQAPSTLNDAMRQWKQLEAAWLDDFGAIASVGGSSTAITVTLSQGFTAYGTGAGQIPNGAIIAIKTGSAATGATTLNVNGIGAKAIRLQGDVAVQSGDWASGAVLVLRYDTAFNSAAGAWVVLDSAIGGYTGTGAEVRATSPTFATSLSVSSSAAGTVATVTSTDAGAGVGPRIDNYRDSASPAANDGIGAMIFNGRDSAGNKQQYSELGVVIVDPVSTTEDSYAYWTIFAAGASQNQLYLGLNGDGNGRPDTVGLPRGQLGFPATQVPSTDANTMDDYEEGTWTPSDGSGAGLSFSGVAGTYVKIGRMVFATYRVTYPVTASGSNARINGLPFTANSSPTPNFQAGSAGAFGAAAPNGASTHLVAASSTYTEFQNGAGALSTNANFSGSAVSGVVIYMSAN